MKNILFRVTLFVLMMVHPLTFAQSDTLWTRTFGGEDRDRSYSAQQTTDGGYIIIGDNRSFDNDQEDLWLIKTDFNGNEEWYQIFGGSGDDRGYSVQQCSDGGYILGGFTGSFGNGSLDLWLIKTDSNGNEEWSQTFGGSGHDRGHSVQQCSDGGYILGGFTGSFGNGSLDIWVIKTDPNGNEIWSQTYGGEGIDSGYSVQQTIEGGYIITGYTGSSGNGGVDVWLIKTDSGGNEEWSQTFGGGSEDIGYSVQQTMDAGYIITGTTFSFGNGNRDAWLIKIDTEGNEEWSQTFGGTGGDYGYSGLQSNDGGYILTGTTDSFGNDYFDVWIVKTDPQGNEEWSQTIGGNDYEESRSIKRTINGGYIISGYTKSFGNGDADIWLLLLEGEEQYPPVEIIIDYQSDWNLLGLPVNVENPYYLTLFPSAIENTLFTFDEAYIPDSIMIEGDGYWLRFDSAGNSTITGNPIIELTNTLNEGWNLISGISTPLDITAIQDPDGIIISGTVYGFTSGGYSNEEIIEPGKGYWIRANSSGSITLIDN
jgi:hypothetical protein